MAELLLCLMLLAVGGLVWNLRDNANPVVLWAWGWIIIVVVAAFMRFAGEVTWVHVSAQLISPLLPAFLLAGARAYTDRPTLNWILPAGLGFGVLRWVVGSFFPDLGHIMSAGAEPAVELVAAFLVMETARDRDAKPSQKILPLAFVAIAILDGATSLAYFWKDAFPTSMTLAWPLVGVTALGLQVTAGGHYIRRRRTALEHESRLARQALRESEQRFGVLAEQAGDLIFEIDSDWNLTYMTDSVAAVLDFRPEDMVGHSAANWIHVDDQERVLEALGAAMNNREPRGRAHVGKTVLGSGWKRTSTGSFPTTATRGSSVLRATSPRPTSNRNRFSVPTTPSSSVSKTGRTNSSRSSATSSARSSRADWRKKNFAPAGNITARSRN